MKQCSRCLETKSLSSFYRNASYKDGYHCWCTECSKVAATEWRAAHRDRLTASQERYEILHREIHKTNATPRRKQSLEDKVKRAQVYRLKKRWGLTLDEFEDMFNAQSRVCKICLQPPKRRVIDHDHATGVVRGILCDRCNTALGLLRDSVAALERAWLHVQ